MSSTPHFTPLPYFTVDENDGRLSGTSALYQDLYRAAHRGDWETTTTILLRDSNLRVATLNVEQETALHVAVGTGKAIHYVQKLVGAMQPVELENIDVYCQTPLMVATIIGNIDAARLLVCKNPKLLYMGDAEELLPVHRTAQYGQKDILLYLLKVTYRNDHSFPYASKSGAKLLANIMEAEFYDVATALIRCFPQLIDESFTGEHFATPPLTMLATNPSAFRCMSFWKRLMYACIPINWQISYDHYIIGSATRVGHTSESLCSNELEMRTTKGEEIQLGQLPCPPRLIINLRSIIQHIRPTKPIRDQALQLVDCLCTHASRSCLLTWEMFKDPFLLAAESGIVEIVEELAETFPNLLWVQNVDKQNIFQIAVICRRQSVFNLVYHIAKDKRYKTRDPDKNGDNILHMAGKLASSHRLNMVSGAALKMRYELQWFEEVGRSIQPFQRTARNKQNKTPKELFTEEHREIVKEGEKWMKSTASSCTTPAALIATVVFAAAITVPGNKIGKLGEATFTVFAVANALSLFTSLSSLLMFVSILTSIYTEDEFLRSLPRRILAGLITLLISIASMMVAFSIIVYLTFGGGEKWILIIVVAAAFVPVTLFVILQYSLLADMVFYWRYPQISGKKGGHPLYTRNRA